MFNRRKQAASNGNATVYATQTGTAVPIEDMPDAVFSGKILGDGVCIIPTGGLVVSPVSGTVVNTIESGHAFGIETAAGAEIMVHIGVDTIRMKGSGFCPRVQKGQAVQAGDALCEVDLAAVSGAGYLLHTAVILTNPEVYRITGRHFGPTSAGASPLFECKKTVG